MVDEKPTKQVPWYAEDSADDTWRLLGGLLIFALALIGLFVMEVMVGQITNPVYLKEGIVHAIFGYITGWISGSSRKKTTTGRTSP